MIERVNSSAFINYLTCHLRYTNNNLRISELKKISYLLLFRSNFVVRNVYYHSTQR